jgi:hypothetical protein
MSKLDQLRALREAQNAGALTINRGRVVPVVQDGKPVQAGDLIAGQRYKIDPTSGEIRKFDRNAYQREYMRKRRAAQKAATGSSPSPSTPR